MTLLTDKAFATVLSLNDLIHMVDVSDLTAGPFGTSKKITLTQLKTIVDSDSQNIDNVLGLGGALTANRTIDGATFDFLFDNIGDETHNVENFNLTATTGDVQINSIKYPKVDGSANYILKTSGAGVLSFVDITTLITGSGIYGGSNSLSGATIVTLTAVNSLSFAGGQTTFKGSGSTPATKTLKIENSSSTEKFFVRDDGMVGAADGYTIGTTLFVHSMYDGSAGDISGGNNTYLGRNVGLLTDTATGLANNNVGIGSLALQNLTGGRQIVGIGQNAFNDLTVGRDNTGVGQNAFAVLTSATESAVSFNTGVGSGAYLSLTTGTYNIALGQAAGTNVTGGNGNICIGASSGGDASGSFSHSIAIGRGAKFDSNNQMVIGESASGAYIQNFHFGRGINNITLDNTGVIFQITSGVGTDKDAANYTWAFKDSAGTGTGDSGGFVFQTAPSGTTGSSQNAHSTAFEIQSDGVVVVKSFVKASLPSVIAGGLIRVSDEVGGDTVAYSDGANWLRVSDGATVS